MRKKRRNSFCNIKCFHQYRSETLRNSGTIGASAMREWLKYYYNNKCNRCGINNWMDAPLVMQMHHIDGNYKNNKMENLQLLCPNCHAQTDTFGLKNRGNGRYFRRERYKKGLSY